MVWYDRLSVFSSLAGKKQYRRGMKKFRTTVSGSGFGGGLCAACPDLPPPPITLQTPALAPITTLPPTHPPPSHLADRPLAPDLLCVVCSTSKTSHLFHYVNKLPFPHPPPATFPVLPYSLIDFFFVPCGLGFLFSEVHERCLGDHREQPVTQHPESLMLPSPDGSLLRVSPLFTQGLHNFMANKIYSEAL